MRTGILLLAAGALLGLANTARSDAVEVAAPQPRIIGLVTEKEYADDIIRRLRRLGINFNKTRLPNPYDPAWEVV